jgi:hypothetical protein
MTLNTVMLSVIYVECRNEAHFAVCHYAERHYTECRYAECSGAILVLAKISSLPVTAECHYGECHCAKCRYGECHCAKCRCVGNCNTFYFTLEFEHLM